MGNEDWAGDRDLLNIVTNYETISETLVSQKEISMRATSVASVNVGNLFVFPIVIIVAILCSLFLVFLVERIQIVVRARMYNKGQCLLNPASIIFMSTRFILMDYCESPNIFIMKVWKRLSDE